MNLTFGVERLAHMYPEAEELWGLHWQETEGYRDEQGYRPDKSGFLTMEGAGNFVEFTARSSDGRLVGHLGYILHVSRHTSRLNAVEDYFYLRPEARKGLNAVRFLRFAVEVLKRAGCCQVGMSSKLTNNIGPLLKRVGFKHVADFYTMNVAENLHSGQAH